MAGVFDSLGNLDGVILSVGVAAGDQDVAAGYAKIAPFIRITGGTIAGRKVNLPAVLWNVVIGADPTNTQSVTLVRGTTSIVLAPGAEAAFYLDGSDNGLNKTVDLAGGSLVLPGVDLGRVVTVLKSISVADGDQTLSPPANAVMCKFFRITGASAVGRVVTIPAQDNLITVGAEAANAQPVTIRCGSASLTLNPGEVRDYYLDGTVNGIVQSSTVGGGMGPGLPLGGTAGQVLQKQGPENFNAAWVDTTSLVPITSLNITADRTDQPSDLNKTVWADATAGAIAYTLPSAVPIDGSLLRVVKTDASANRVTVKSGAVEMAWLSAQGDMVLMVYRSGAWKALAWNLKQLRQVFTSSGTYTKPPLMSLARVVLIGAGGGAGSGRRGAAASLRCGGAGGLPGMSVLAEPPASAFGLTEAITIGAGGTGGAAVTVDSTNGNAGNNGGVTSIGAIISVNGGAGGPGGNATASVSAATATGRNEIGAGTAAGSGSTTATAGGGGDSANAGGGGGGGGLDAADVRRSGGAGGDGTVTRAGVATGGPGGTTAGASGTAGTSITDSDKQIGGGGGGGGSAGLPAGGIGGDGANGGNPGGGSGGGGASLNGFNSGKGGDGGRGEVRITAYF